MSTKRHLAKSTGIIGALTGVSRLLGFVRDLMIAAFFGTGASAEAFVVSFKIPNLFRDLVGEGAMNSAFVPVLTEELMHRKNEFWRLVSALFIVMSLVLATLTVAGLVYSEGVVRLIAPGFSHSPDPIKFILAVRLTQLIFPYLFLIGMSALAMGVLNSLKEFTSSALGPILLNMCMIASGYLLEARYGVTALVGGVLCGGLLQLTAQIWMLFRKGLRFERPDFKLPAILKIGRLLVPRALGSALYQVNVFVDSILASFESIVGPGGQSALYYSNRLFQLPLAVFGLSLAQAVLPTFSGQMARKNLEEFKDTLSSVLRALALVIFPAAVGLIVLAEPIVRILFQHGKFDAYSTMITSSALTYYGFGLASCCFLKIFVNAFYAMQDTRTPLKTMFIAVVLNVVLCLIFMRSLKIGGLALASTISATCNLACLYVMLRKRIGPLPEAEIGKSFLKIFIAAASMGVMVAFYNDRVLNHSLTTSTSAQALLLGIGIALGGIAYVAFTLILKVTEMQKAFSWLIFRR